MLSTTCKLTLFDYDCRIDVPIVGVLLPHMCVCVPHMCLTKPVSNTSRVCVCVCAVHIALILIPPKLLDTVFIL